MGVRWWDFLFAASPGAHEALPTRLGRVLLIPMRLSRTILASLFALLFLVSTNSCLIAAAFPGVVASCCENERSGAGETGEAGSCECAAVEAPVVPVVLTVVRPVPQWTPEGPLTEWMARLRATAREPLAVRLPDDGVIPRSSWPDVVKRCQPVRGPSFVA
jgi:hypothetical protein